MNNKKPTVTIELPVKNPDLVGLHDFITECEKRYHAKLYDVFALLKALGFLSMDNDDKWHDMLKFWSIDLAKSIYLPGDIYEDSVPTLKAIIEIYKKETFENGKMVGALEKQEEMEEYMDELSNLKYLVRSVMADEPDEHKEINLKYLRELANEIKKEFDDEERKSKELKVNTK